MKWRISIATVFLCLTLFGRSAAAQIGLVQSNAGAWGFNSDKPSCQPMPAYNSVCTLAFPSNNGAGHLIVVSVQEYTSDNCTAVSITDTTLNSYTRQSCHSTFCAGASCQDVVWYTCSSKSGANTITISDSTLPSNITIIIEEWSGLPTSGCLQTAATPNGCIGGGCPNPMSSFGVTTTFPIELLIGINHVFNGATTSAPSSSPYTNGQFAEVNRSGVMLLTSQESHKVTTTTGTYTNQWTYAGGSSVGGFEMYNLAFGPQVLSSIRGKSQTY